MGTKPALVNSLPKSGTNLVSDCLQLLGFEFEEHLGGGVVRQPRWTRPLKRILYAPFRGGLLVGIDMPIEVAEWRIQHSLRGLRSSEYITTHAGYTVDFLLEALDCDIAPILVTRDPRAVVNSFVHHVIDEERQHPLQSLFLGKRETEQFRAAIGGVRRGSMVLQPIDVRCRALSPWVNHPDVLHVRFEDLVGPEGGGSVENQRTAITAIADHVGADRERVEYVMNHLFGKNQHTFRSGQISSWRHEVPEAVRDELDTKTDTIRDMWGYTDFPGEPRDV